MDDGAGGVAVGATAALYRGKDDTYFSAARVDYVDALPSDGSAKILELGCGSGETGALALARGKCETYVGIELVPEYAALAARKLSHVVVGDIEALEIQYSDDSFDVLICSEVLEHLVDPWATLTRLVRLLKPGGRVLASSPNVAHFRVIARLASGRFDYEGAGVMDRSHLRWFTPMTFRALFEQAGVAVDLVAPLTGNPILRRLPQWVPFSHLAWSQIDLRGRRKTA